MEINSQQLDSSPTTLSVDRVINSQSLQEELKCRICLGILRQPQECKQCENCFCEDCLDEWLKNSYQCPMRCSGEPKFRDKAHKIVRNLLSELIFQCKNHQNGCLQEVGYDKLKEHEERCEYEILACSGAQDGCKVKFVKREMEQHEKICQLVPVTCEFCKKKVKRSGIKAHWMYCEEAELSCEYCSGVFKKKNYLIHVNALCEEYQMNCGRCSGTFKRKYKEFHDCIRHLQNCQKTLTEDIITLREKMIEKDKKICELENRVFFELSDIKLTLQKIQEQQNGEPRFPGVGNSHSRISSINDSNGYELLMQPQVPIAPTWKQSDLKLFELVNEEKSVAQFQIEQAQSRDNDNEISFGYVYSEYPMVQTSIIELEIQQQMATNFTPMFYILGVVSTLDLPKLPSLDTFDSLYYLLSPTCCFIPSFSKSFCDKLRFQLRKITKPSLTILTYSVDPTSNIETMNQQGARIEIEEMDKKKKEKVIQIGEGEEDKEWVVFFGVYCQQKLHLANHKLIKVRVY